LIQIKGTLTGLCQHASTMGERFDNDLLAMVCGLSLGLTLGMGVTSDPSRWQIGAQTLCMSAAAEAGQDVGSFCGMPDPAWTIAER